MLTLNRRYLLTLGGLAALAGAIPGCAVSVLAPGQPAASVQLTPVGGYSRVSASELAKMLKQKDFLFVNVHIPYQGEIEGTDLFLPYDQVESSLGKLPSEKGAKIVLYCRSGSMSTTAANTLVKLGYTSIIELSGGMGAWQEAGYQLVEKPGR